MSPLFLDRWWRFYLRILNGTKKRNTDTTTASASAPRELVRQRAGSGEVFTRLSRGRTRLSPFAPGSLEKIGRGALRLSGDNIYAGGTTIEGGTLLVANRSGSATGTGPVNITAGTLGGSGIIAGSVTIGTGAFLAPAAGSNVPATLTIQNALTFKADATYTCTLRKNRNGTRTDEVIANGVTINSGALVALSGQTMGALTQGMTLISNTLSQSH